MSATLVCSFCKAEGHSRVDGDGNITCLSLLSNKCTYCKKTGHTNKRCPVAKANNLAKNAPEHCPCCKKTGHTLEQCFFRKNNEKTAKASAHIEAEIKAGSYAGHLMKSVTVAERESIEAQERAFARELYLREKSERERKQLAWETEYPGRMTVKFGPFWFFYVIGTKYDCPKVADQFRTPEAQVAYCNHLEAKYGEGWMFESLIGEDKCDFLIEMIKDIRVAQQVATVEDTRRVVDEITELSKVLSPDELRAHIDISTNEFMEGMKDFKDEGEWTKKRVKKGKAGAKI